MLCRGCLAGREQAVATQGDNLLQSFQGLRADVESAVEGDAQAFRRFNEITDGFLVNAAIRLQGSYHDTIRAQPLGKPDVANHALHLCLVIDEVALSGANQHLNRNAQTDGLLHHLFRRRQTIHIESPAKLNPVSSASLCRKHALHVAATNL